MSQRQWRDTLYGAPGDLIQIVSEQGLHDLDVISGSRPLPRGDGSIPGLHTVAEKSITQRLWLAADTPAEAETLMAGFRAQTGPSRDVPEPFRFRHAGGDDKFVWARVIHRSEPRTVDTERHGLFEFTVQFEVTDPRIYSVATVQELVPEFDQADDGGFQWPVDWPIDMEVGALSTAVLVHAGGTTAWPLIRFQHPGAGTCNGVTLTNLTTGDVFVLAFPNLLVAGQTLTADMGLVVQPFPAGPPIHIAGSSRVGTWVHPRVPLGLRPGANTLRFDIDGTAEIVCLVTWRTTDL